MTLRYNIPFPEEVFSTFLLLFFNYVKGKDVLFRYTDGMIVVNLRNNQNCRGSLNEGILSQNFKLRGI